VNIDLMPWLDPFNTSLSVLLLLTGLLCLLARRNVVKQVSGLSHWLSASGRKG
jgi:hydrogenase-4 membrane subunit HyfE